MLNVNLSFTIILVWVLVGGAAGWLASQSCVARAWACSAISSSVLGAFLGGLVLSSLLLNVFSLTGGFTGFNLGSLIVAFIGAVVLLVVVRLFTGMRTRSEVR